MKAFIVYCHPSEESFTSHVRDSFIKGIVDSGNEYVISDLYKMDFKSDMTEQEYLRDANYRTAPAVTAGNPVERLEQFGLLSSMKKVMFGDRFFTAVENSETGEVSDKTIFAYHQKESTILAEYSGGSVVKGFLIGTMDENQNLHFSYQHINTEGQLKSGSCDSEPKIENGKLRFYEKWKWTNGESGTSMIEEI